jgi:hypothetical protein
VREGELIALVPTIRDELAAANLHADLEQPSVIFGDLMGPEKTAAYDALSELEVLLADISGLPENSGVTPVEWDVRRTDFCQAAELYLDARWKQTSGGKSH